MHRIDVGSFEHYGQDNISKLGRRDPESNRAKPRAFYRVALSDLHSWAAAPPNQDGKPSRRFAGGLKCTPVAVEQRACSNVFWNIKEQAEQWIHRPHYWHSLGLFVFCLQVAIFVFGVGPLFLNPGTPLFMFSCDNYLSSLWMLITAATNAVFRLTMWEFSAHERVRVYSLSENGKISLRALLGQLNQDPGEGSQGILGSTEIDLPPRYHPLISRIILSSQQAISPPVRHGRKRYLRVNRNNSQDQDEDSSSVENGSLEAAFQWIWKELVSFWRLWVRYPFKHPIQFIRISFSSKSSPDCARRWRPLTVLLHLTNSGRNPFAKLLTGLVEGSILLLLTVFFASQWGGNIFVVSYTIAMLLLIVTVGRLLSIMYIWRSAYFLGLHVIECQSNSQISGCLRILCSLPDVLVVVNGAYYYGGHCLNLKPAWAAWRKRYDRGEFDEATKQQSAVDVDDSDEEALDRRLSIPRRPVGATLLPWTYHDREHSHILLQDLSVSPMGHSQFSSERSRDLSMQRAPDAAAGHETV
ncbi:hypothetical protein B0J12DRAFT_653990 [Macrophomina phaseolina]|uniref:Uncharacterized protein n=1 Tax=Macrophomina phaseolina TaxID=35725 RepID=A0ABQ8GM42_9PEZI|nr:hypothetical protein B0J12DRAFT_653990 [Macrophomina phaseolina]